MKGKITALFNCTRTADTVQHMNDACWRHQVIAVLRHTRSSWMCKVSSLARFSSNQEDSPHLWWHLHVLPVGLLMTGPAEERRWRRELIRPYRQSPMMCWRTEIPPDSLPTQTDSCSPTPAASFVPCKLPQCLQSVGGGGGTTTDPESHDHCQSSIWRNLQLFAWTWIPSWMCSSVCESVQQGSDVDAVVKAEPYILMKIKVILWSNLF